MYAWGCNAQHQLGFQDTQQRSVPTLLPHLPLSMSVAACMVSLVVSRKGRLYVFGYDPLLNPAPYEDPRSEVGEGGVLEVEPSKSGLHDSTCSNPSWEGLSEVDGQEAKEGPQPVLLPVPEQEQQQVETVQAEPEAEPVQAEPSLAGPVQAEASLSEPAQPEQEQQAEAAPAVQEPQHVELAPVAPVQTEPAQAEQQQADPAQADKEQGPTDVWSAKPQVVKRRAAAEPGTNPAAKALASTTTPPSPPSAPQPPAPAPPAPTHSRSPSPNKHVHSLPTRTSLSSPLGTRRSTSSSPSKRTPSRPPSRVALDPVEPPPFREVSLSGVCVCVFVCGGYKWYA